MSSNHLNGKEHGMGRANKYGGNQDILNQVRGSDPNMATVSAQQQQQYLIPANAYDTFIQDGDNLECTMRQSLVISAHWCAYAVMPPRGNDGGNNSRASSRKNRR
jgi:hypothetical protein